MRTQQLLLTELCQWKSGGIQLEFGHLLSHQSHIEEQGNALAKLNGQFGCRLCSIQRPFALNLRVIDLYLDKVHSTSNFNEVVDVIPFILTFLQEQAEIRIGESTN